MQAIVQDRYGSPDVLALREIAMPTVAEDEVLVRVRAASIHPDVWHVMHGRPYVMRLAGLALLRPKHPVPGIDLAGVVEAVGAGVTRFRPGDEVFGETIKGYQWRNGGAFAEYAAAPDGTYVIIGHDGYGATGGPWLGSLPRVLRLVAIRYLEAGGVQGKVVIALT